MQLNKIKKKQFYHCPVINKTNNGLIDCLCYQCGEGDVLSYLVSFMNFCILSGSASSFRRCRLSHQSFNRWRRIMLNQGVIGPSRVGMNLADKTYSSVDHVTVSNRCRATIRKTRGATIAFYHFTGFGSLFRRLRHRYPGIYLTRRNTTPVAL